MSTSRAIGSFRVVTRGTKYASKILPGQSLNRRSMSTKMVLKDFSNFHVPLNLIAQSPAFPRDSSRLMVEQSLINSSNIQTSSVIQCFCVMIFWYCMSRS
jgi:hypothetical protein